MLSSTAAVFETKLPPHVPLVFLGVLSLGSPVIRSLYVNAPGIKATETDMFVIRWMIGNSWWFVFR